MPEESRRFLDGLDKPFQPNARLKKAMEEAEGLLKPLRR
ncbi:type II toxin -antitoxin system TacA 1-like antitoxin [Lautropia mirabilis]